ncbi:buccalin-like isoform X1 [Mytilus edulis]|uniref:buccalin-like isoform X1 n=1 Tax=Mytilus edulis TaxID=6550 RepID=UPI0039EEDA2B
MVSSVQFRCVASAVIYLILLCNELVCQESTELSKDDELLQYKRKMDMYRFHGSLGKRQDEQPIPEDQFEKRKIDYARFLGSLGKRANFDDSYPEVERRSKYDRYMFAPSLGKRYVDPQETMEADKRRLDRFSYFGNLGKRGMDKLSYFGSLGKRGLDRLSFFGGLGKRRMDRLSYFGGLGKRSRDTDERYNNIDSADNHNLYDVNDILPARDTRSWYWTNRGTKRLPVSIRGIDKYSLFGSLGKRSIDQDRLQEILGKRLLSRSRNSYKDGRVH